MVAAKDVIGEEEIPEDVDMSDSSSDVSMSEDEEEFPEDSHSEEDEQAEAAAPQEEEEEDEVIKAIKRENQRESDHPPIIRCEDFITDISFHPKEDIIAAATITGDVVLYKYSKQENTLLNTIELHTKACRDIEFSQDGKILFSSSKDKSVMLSDVETGKLIRFYDDAHDVPIYCLSVLSEDLFATGKYFRMNS